MDTAAEIKRALIMALGINPNLAITANVVSIEDDTCTIKLASGLKLSDVRLKATISEDGQNETFLLIPKIGSEVIVISQTGDLTGLMVLKIDKVEKVLFKNGDFEFQIDLLAKKVTIKKAGANVGVLVSQLIDTVSNAQVITPSGTGTIDSATKLQLTNIKNAFKSILNNN